MKAQIWNNSWWITETREKALDTLLGKIVAAAGFNVLKTMEHEFSPFGYTKLWLLAESHLALHTFPECGKAYVELSSCNQKYFDVFALEMERRTDELGIVKQ